MRCVVAVVVVIPSPAEVRGVGVSYGGLFTRGDISSAIVDSEGPTFLADHLLSVAVCVQGLVWQLVTLASGASVLCSTAFVSLLSYSESR